MANVEFSSVGFGMNSYQLCDTYEKQIDTDFEEVSGANLIARTLIPESTLIEERPDARFYEVASDKIHEIAERVRERRQARKDAKLAPFKLEAASTGKPVLIRSWNEPDDDEDEGWIVHDILMQSNGEITEQIRRTY